MLMGHATQADDKQRRNNKENREEIDGLDYRTDRWKNTYCFVVQWVDGVNFSVFCEKAEGWEICPEVKKMMITSTVKLDLFEKSWHPPLIRFADTMCSSEEWPEWWLWAPFHFNSENSIMAIYYFIIYYFIAIVLVFILSVTQFQHKWAILRNCVNSCFRICLFITCAWWKTAGKLLKMWHIGVMEKFS